MKDLVSEGEGALTLGGKHINSNNRLDLSEPDYLSWDKYEESPEIKVSKGDIITSQRGTLGRSAYIFNDIGKATINPSMVLLKKFKEDGIFLYYTLIHQNFIKEVYRRSSSTAVPMISQSELKKININFPSLNEQKKIANFLSNVDEKLELLNQKLNQTTQFKKYLMQNIFSQKLRFDENCQYATKKVKDFLVESKIEGTDDINKRLTVKLNLKGITIRESKTIEIEGATKQFIRKSGQFIYGKQNLHKGAFGIVPKELDGYLTSSDIPSFDFKGEIEPKWFYYYFSRKSFYEKLESLSTGTGSKRISPKEFLNIKIIVPEIEEQHRIVYLLEKFDEKINGISNQITQMDMFKKSLLQQMFV